MTGYGEAAAESERHAISVSMRGVNHRFLDLQLRSPEQARGAEQALRDLVGRSLARGRVEMRVEVRPLTERQATVHVHRGVVEAAFAATHQLIEEGLVVSGLGAGDLLRIPEAFRVELAGEGWGEEDEALLLEVAAEGLAQLVAGREREGASLAAVMADRLRELTAVIADSTACAERSATSSPPPSSGGSPSSSAPSRSTRPAWPRR
jgi:uncharacterized protein (TIGR00255 family)